MVTPLRVVMFGTPAFAVPTLAGLCQSRHDVVAVVTQPDRPRGRGQRVTPSAVKAEAVAASLPVLQPERLRDEAFYGTLESLRPDLGVVAAYGQLLPQRLLDLPRLGCINVHASLLPRWRGAAPVHRAIMAGDTETGVTIMRVVLALDAGPMLARAVVPIGADETSTELEARLAETGARLAVEVTDRLAQGTVAGEPQDDSAATYAPRLERREGEVDWARPAVAIHNQIRGLQPWPLAAALLRQERVRLWQSAVAGLDDDSAVPGTIVDVSGNALVVATKPGRLRLLKVQPDGRPVMSVRDFLNGRVVTVGDRFTPLAARP
jgi:methionyl-tRNA formyltransferase